MKSGITNLFVTVIGLAAALIPVNSFAALGDLYEADFFSHTIFKFTPTGTKSTFASGQSLSEDLAFDRSGDLFEGTVAAARFSNSRQLEPRPPSPPG